MNFAGTFYKILVDGQPCHGGSGAYPPIGEWTTPVKPCVCRAGYHVTSDPLKWWKAKARLFVVECDGAFDGENDDKLAFERVRLVAEITRKTPGLMAFPRLRMFLALSARSLDRDADISWANLSGAYFSGANLSRANLSGVDLSRANLSGAYLSSADLSRANLSGANLSSADLSGVDLSRANLSGAYLSSADLSRANLSRANLSGAYLSSANLNRANLSGAYLSGVDLSSAYRPTDPPSGYSTAAFGYLVRETAVKS